MMQNSFVLLLLLSGTLASQQEVRTPVRHDERPAVIREPLVADERAARGSDALRAIDAILEVETTQTMPRGIRFVLELVNRGAASAQLTNPLDLLNPLVRDSNGALRELRSVPPRFLVHRDDGVVERPFRVRAITRKRGEVTDDISSGADRDTRLVLAAGAIVRFSCEIDLFSVAANPPAIASRTDVPVTAGEYTLALLLSVSRGPEDSRMLQSKSVALTLKPEERRGSDAPDKEIRR